MNAIMTRGKALRLAVTMMIGAMILAGCSDCNLPPATPDGTWSGVVSDTYFCEGDSFTIELDIDGSALSVTDGTTFLVGTTGTLTQQENEAYTVALDLAGGGEGLLYIDPTATYGLILVHASAAGYRYAIGVLQKGSLGPVSFAENDLVGEWEGVEFRVDAGLAVTSTAASSATVTAPEGLLLEGTDSDGDFSGTLALADGTTGVYASWPSPDVDWPLFSRSPIGTLSADKQVFAVAFMTSLCEYGLDEVLPEQKFAVWVRQ
jgi:hypothetical protein